MLLSLSAFSLLDTFDMIIASNQFLLCLLYFSDPAMKQFLLHLDEKNILGRRFIIQDLDEKHLFISVDIVETLQAKIDDLMDSISVPVHDKEN